MSDNIHVAVRVRPLITRESSAANVIHWSCGQDNTITHIDPNSRKSLSPPYIFDHVFGSESTNEEVYCKAVEGIVEATLSGFNGTVFAYGQTSSGKTHTMMGDRKKEPGVIPLAIRSIFRSIENTPHREYLLRASYMEIYNENISDLLAARDAKSKSLIVREDLSGMVYVADLKEECVNTEDKLLALMKQGEKNRHTGITNMNERSSRSHTIFRLILESRERTEEGEGEEAVNLSHLNLVDLAGSENASQTGATGDRLKEGGFINKSLFMLGRVISQLSEGEQFVNFRDSKLTRILQLSLGGNAKTAIICTVTPAAVEQTHSTLRFASRAKAIKNKPMVNEVLSDTALLKRYEREIKNLKQSLIKERSTDKAQEVEQVREMLDEKDRRNAELEQKINDLKAKLVVSSHVTSSSKDTWQKKRARRETWAAPALARVSRTSVGFLHNLPLSTWTLPPQDSDSALNTTTSSTCKFSLSTLDQIPENDSESEEMCEETVNFNKDLPDFSKWDESMETASISKNVSCRRRKRAHFEDTEDTIPEKGTCEAECQTDESLLPKLSLLSTSRPSTPRSTPHGTPAGTPSYLLRARNEELQQKLVGQEEWLNNWRGSYEDLQIYQANELHLLHESFERKMGGCLDHDGKPHEELQELEHLRRSLQDCQVLLRDANCSLSQKTQEVVSLQQQLDTFQKENEKLSILESELVVLRTEHKNLLKDMKEKNNRLKQLENERADFDLMLEFSVKQQKHKVRRSLDAYCVQSDPEKGGDTLPTPHPTLHSTMSEATKTPLTSTDISYRLSETLQALEDSFLPLSPGKGSENSREERLSQQELEYIREQLLGLQEAIIMQDQVYQRDLDQVKEEKAFENLYHLQCLLQSEEESTIWIQQEDFVGDYILHSQMPVVPQMTSGSQMTLQEPDTQEDRDSPAQPVHEEDYSIIAEDQKGEFSDEQSSLRILPEHGRIKEKMAGSSLLNVTQSPQPLSLADELRMAGMSDTFCNKTFETTILDISSSNSPAEEIKSLKSQIELLNEENVELTDTVQKLREECGKMKETVVAKRQCPSCGMPEKRQRLLFSLGDEEREGMKVRSSVSNFDETFKSCISSFSPSPKNSDEKTREEKDRVPSDSEHSDSDGSIIMLQVRVEELENELKLVLGAKSKLNVEIEKLKEELSMKNISEEENHCLRWQVDSLKEGKCDLEEELKLMQEEYDKVAVHAYYERVEEKGGKVEGEGASPDAAQETLHADSSHGREHDTEMVEVVQPGEATVCPEEENAPKTATGDTDLLLLDIEQKTKELEEAGALISSMRCKVAQFEHILKEVGSSLEIPSFTGDMSEEEVVHVSVELISYIKKLKVLSDEKCKVEDATVTKAEATENLVSVSEKKELEEALRKIAQLSAEMEQLQKDSGDKEFELEKMITYFSDKEEGHEKEVEKLKREKEELNEALVNKDLELVNLKEECGSSKTTSSDLEAALAGVREAHSCLEENYSKLKNDLANVEIQYSNKILEMEKLVENYKEELATQSKVVDELKQSLVDQEQLVEEKEEDCRKLQAASERSLLMSSFTTTEKTDDATVSVQQEMINQKLDELEQLKDSYRDKVKECNRLRDSVDNMKVVSDNREKELKLSISELKEEMLMYTANLHEREEEVCNLKEELKSKAEGIENLKSAVAAKDHKLRHLQEDLAAARDTISSTENELQESLRAVEEEMSRRVAELEEELGRLKVLYDEVCTDRKAMAATLHTLEHQHTQHKEECQDLHHKLHILTEENNNTINKLHGREEEIAAKMEVIAALESKEAALLGELSSVKEEKATLAVKHKEEKEHLQELVEKSETELSEKEEKIQLCKKDVVDAQAQMSGMAEEISSLRHMQEEMAALRCSLDQRSQSTEDLQAKVSSLQKELESTGAAHRSMMEKVQETTVSSSQLLSEKEEEIKVIASEKNELASQLSKVEEKHSAIMKTLERQEIQLQEKCVLLQESTSENETLTAELRNATENYKKTEIALKVLETQSSQKISALESEKQRLEELVSFTTNSQKDESKNERIEELEHLAQVHKACIAEKVQEVESLREQISGCQTQLSEMEKQVLEMKVVVKEKTARIVELEEMIHDLRANEENAVRQQKEIKQLQKKNDELMEQYTRVEQELGKLYSDQKKQRQLSESEQNITQDKNIDILATENKKLSSKLGRTEQELELAQERARSVEQELLWKSERLQERQEECSNLEKKIKDLVNQIQMEKNEKKGTAVGAEEEVDALRRKIVSLENELAEKEKAVKALDAEADELVTYYKKEVCDMGMAYNQVTDQLEKTQQELNQTKLKLRGVSVLGESALNVSAVASEKGLQNSSANQFSENITVRRQSRVAGLEKEKEALREMCAEMKDKNEKLEHTIQELQLAMREKEEEVQLERDNTRAKCQQLQQELVQAEEKLKGLQQELLCKSEQLQKRQEECSLVENKPKDMIHRKQVEESATAVGMEEVDSLRKKVESLEEKLAEKERANAALDAEMDEIVAYYKKEVVNMGTAYNDVTEQLEKTQEVLNQTKSKLRETSICGKSAVEGDQTHAAASLMLEENVTVRRRQTVKLEKELDSVREVCAQLEKKNKELEHTIKQLQQKEWSTEELQHQILMLKEQVEDAQFERNTARAKYQQLQQELEEAKKHSPAKMADGLQLRREVEALREKNALLKKSLSQVTAEASVPEPEQEKGDEESLHEKYLAMRRENCELRLRLRALNAPAEKEAEALRGELSTANEKINFYKKELRRLQNVNAMDSTICEMKGAAMKKAPAMHKTEPYNYSCSSGSVSEMLVLELENKLYHLEKENKKKEMELSATDQHITHYQQKAQQWKNRALSEQRTVEKLRKELKQVHEELQRLDTQQEESRTLIQRLNFELGHKREQVEHLEKEKQEQRNQAAAERGRPARVVGGKQPTVPLSPKKEKSEGATCKGGSQSSGTLDLLSVFSAPLPCQTKVEHLPGAEVARKTTISPSKLPSWRNRDKENQEYAKFYLPESSVKRDDDCKTQ